MNLIIDIGNTAVKLAVFNQQHLVCKTTCSEPRLIEEIEQLIVQFPALEKAMVSSVKNTYPDLNQKLKLAVHHLNSRLRLPFKNYYKTPDSIGTDRLALMAAACSQYPNTNVLVIDAGSCITYDFLSSEAAYYGGAISPGIAMRYKSLNEFTAKLPHLEKKSPNYYTGQTTEEAIHSGIVNGVESEIKAQISHYVNNFTDLTVILTGGDTNFLCNRLKSTIFANSNFLLEGLNSLLEFNSSE